MNPRMVDRLRRGQGEERDRRLGLLLIERGILSAEEAHELRRDCEPGGFGEMLVRTGRMTPEQRERIDEEAAIREVMAVVAGKGVPEEVRDAGRNTLARIGKYVLVRVVGRGGMGEVWKAWDGHLGRSVALKFLRGGDRPEEIQRFLREANLASKLSHPGITRVYDVVPGPHKFFLAMEFVEGRSLDGVKLEPRRAAEIVRDAARATHYAHEQGVLHRDIKPANLLESAGRKIFLTDFGLARSVASGDTMTAPGAALGTPAFMAPEQAGGRPMSRETDVFGLGATLFSLLEGHAPYAGNNQCEILHRAAQGRVPATTVKGELAAIVRKAMEPERRDRYATAAGLADDLDRWLRGEPIQARPIGPLRRLGRRILRRPAIPALSLLLLAALPLVGLLSARAIRDAGLRERRKRAEAEIQEVRRALTEVQLLRSAPKAERTLMEDACRNLDARIEAALRQVADYPPALYFRAVLLSYQERFEEADALFSRLLEIDPAYQDARAQRGLARFYRLQWLPVSGVLDEGGFRAKFAPYEADSRPLLESSAKDFEALPADHPIREYGLALTAFASGRCREARDALRRTLTLHPYALEAYHVLAMAELLCGDAVEAERNATRVIENGRGTAGSFGTRAFIRATLGRFDLAVDDARAALAGRQNWESLRRFMAGWLVHLARFPEADREYDHLLGGTPANADDLLNRSIARVNLRRFEEALRDAGRACELQPGNPWAHWRLGVNHVATATASKDAGDAATALTHLQEADASFTRMIPLLPNDPEPFVRRGKVRLVIAGFSEALADFQEAVRLGPALEPSLKDLMDECRKRSPR